MMTIQVHPDDKTFVRGEIQGGTADCPHYICITVGDVSFLIQADQKETAQRIGVAAFLAYAQACALPKPNGAEKLPDDIHVSDVAF